MDKMNLHLQEMERLRKEVSDLELSKLELSETNQYLKKEINQVS
jgi:hypothetical protein